ncbi:MAG: hypothetical protein LCH67_19695 [Bacteroidetes bacterium]|nr:hypothetical protein [Bacteroidota bacterium]
MKDKEPIHEKKFKRMSKRSLKEFNIEEARGWTIDRLQQIEYRINAKIIEYFKPADKHKFEKIILNSSILDIGSKLKILRNTETVDKQTIDKIRNLAAIRNGFAHAPIKDHIRMSVDTKLEGGIDKTSIVVQSFIEVMNSQGDIKSKNAFDYLVEFWTLNKEIREKI